MQGDLQEVDRLGRLLNGTIVYFGAEPARDTANTVERFHSGGGKQAEKERQLPEAHD